MHGLSIIDVIVDAVKFKGWKDVDNKEKIMWIIKYPLFLILFLWVLAMFCGMWISFFASGFWQTITRPYRLHKVRKLARKR